MHVRRTACSAVAAVSILVACSMAQNTFTPDWYSQVQQTCSSNVWVDKFQTLTAFDQNNRAASQIGQNKSGGAWVTSSKEIYYFGAGANLYPDSIQLLYMNPLTQQLIPYGSEKFAYTPAKLAISYAFSFGGTSTQSGRMVMYFDNQQRLTFDTSYTTVGGAEVPSSYAACTYASGLTVTSKDSYDTTGKSWKNDEIDSTFQNASGKDSVQLRYDWQSGTSTWALTQKTTTVYENGKIVSTLVQTLNGTAWVNSSRTLYSYAPVSVAYSKQPDAARQILTSAKLLALGQSRLFPDRVHLFDLAGRAIVAGRMSGNASQVMVAHQLTINK